MKIKSLKKKISSDTFSEAYPIGADAVNVDLEKGTNVEEEITSINTSIENINNSITSLTNNKLSKADVVDNLTTADASKALSANQGKVLNEAKLNKSDVVNNVTTTDASKALSAAQGKSLQDQINTANNNINAKLNKSDVINNLNTTDSSKALSAAQGKSLQDQINTANNNINNKLNKSNVVNNLTTTASGYALDARQGKALNDALNSHKSSGDHDGRYYTESEVNSLLNNKANANHSHSYLPLSGGMMSGHITFNSAAQHGVKWSSGAEVYSPSSQNLYLRASEQGNYYLHLGVHDNMWTLDPDVNGMLTLGSPNHKWGTIYANNGSINTSDRNLKNTIQLLDDRYIQFFMKLLPVSFKFNDGTSGRTHIGFIAQDVEQAMNEVGLTDLEFAGFCKDQKTIPVKKTAKVKAFNEKTGEEEWKEITYVKDEPVEGEYIYSLRYEEFIALNTAVIQNLIKRVEKLEKFINQLY